jgi:hypothetical protein
MATVYIIFSESIKKFYIGYTLLFVGVITNKPQF